MAEYQNKTKSDHVLDIHKTETKTYIDKGIVKKNKSGRMR